jgi:nicotinamidase-related amidase
MLEMKALVVIDAQNDFFYGALGSETARNILPKLADKIWTHREIGSDILLTRDTHDKDYLESQEGKHLPVPHCIIGTRGWELCDEIKEALGVYKHEIYNKPTFGSTLLAAYFNRNRDKYTEIEIVGVVSSICVVTNALLIKTYCPETSVVVDATCVAGITDDDYYASLKVMEMCQIKVRNNVGN